VDIYWYWPYLRREELAPVTGMLVPGDHLLVHTTPRDADPIASPVSSCVVDASLPAVADRRERTPRWVASRAATYFGRVRARRAALRSAHFDVCHVVYLNRFTDPWDLARIARGAALVSSVHDVEPHVTRLPGAVENKLLHSLYRRSGTIVVHHDFLRRRLVDGFAVDPGRVHVVPLPVIAPEQGSDVPTGDGEPVVLFFGTFRQNKGVSVLLDAIERLRGETDARFVFAGRGTPELERLVSEAARRNPRVEAEIGYATATRKQQLYAGADLAVLPYTSFASQSAVLQEAYAHAVPAIVSDVGALGETIREDGTGWVVEPGRADALAATLLGALADADGRARAAAAARVIARERAPLLVGRRLRQVYERAMAERRR
jgi:glycosyltransferase involved in cell wall biosynthesis